jgi:hypothetical protein
MPSPSMLANMKYIYALDMWTVEERPTGWYFSKSAYHGDRHDGVARSHVHHFKA